MQVPEYLGAGARQFGFMLRGLESLQAQLSELNIAFHLTRGNPEQTIPKLAQEVKAGAIVVDQSPVRIAQKWRTEVSAQGSRMNACLAAGCHSPVAYCLFWMKIVTMLHKDVQLHSFYGMP